MAKLFSQYQQGQYLGRSGADLHQLPLLYVVSRRHVPYMAAKVERCKGRKTAKYAHCYGGNLRLSDSCIVCKARD